MLREMAKVNLAVLSMSAVCSDISLPLEQEKLNLAK